MGRPNRFFNSIVFKNTLMSVGIVLLIVIPAALFYLHDIENSMMDGLAARLSVVARQGGKAIEIEQIKRLAAPQAAGNESRADLVAVLARIQREFEVDNAVIYRRLPSKKFVYVADGFQQFPLNSPVKLHEMFPETYVTANRAWETKQLQDSRLFLSGKTKWLQVNLPLISGGNVAAVLMLNKNGQAVADKIEERKLQILLGMLAVLVLGIFACAFSTFMGLRPIVALTQAAKQISDGNLDVRLKPMRGRNEFAELTLAFQTMIRKFRDYAGDQEAHRQSLEYKINELRMAEEALKESEDRFHTIFDHSNDAIFVVNPQADKILDANRKASEILQYSREELLATPMSEIHPNEMAQMVTFANNVFETGHGWTDEISCRTSNNVFLRAEISASVIMVGEVKCLLAMVRDITERKIMEETRLADQRQEVKENVTAREKAEEMLRQSQKMEAVGQLAGGIAHEFNNMLQVIINGIQYVRDHIHEPEMAKKYLGITLKSAERSAELTKQLLAYSRKSALKPTAVDLNELIADLTKLVRPIIGQDIEMISGLAEDLVPVIADEGMIKQSLMNLCINARDAMPDGGRLVIETKNHHADQEYCDLHGWKQPGDYAIISVSDNGNGMSAEIREQIFEPFFTTKEVGQGTGLGLAMVHGIIQQHDGVIDVHSEPGVGSTFNIYLPKADSKEVGKKAPVVGESPGGSETILVAEDEEDVLNMLTKTLERKGYRVLTAKDGEEAISVFNENTDCINLVLLDFVMPKQGGRKVYEQIRASGSEVPVLFSSGYSLDFSDEGFVAGDGVHTIQKPYGPQEIYTIVREILDGR